MPATTPREDAAIRAAVIRLARPDGDGGAVIERAAILAEGLPAAEIEAWIVAHGGEPEAPLIVARSGRYGLRPAGTEPGVAPTGGEPEPPLFAARPGRYALRPAPGLLGGGPPPRRYVLPTDALV